MITDYNTTKQPVKALRSLSLVWICLNKFLGGNRMKILQINTVCGIGSTGRIVTDIHKMLIGQGHESIIAYGRRESNIIKIIYRLKLGILL